MASAAPMSADEIFAMLKRIIVSQFNVKEAEIGLDAGFDDLDMDSIDAVDLAVSVEQECGFVFEAEDLVELETLGDVVERIRRGTGGPA